MLEKSINYAKDNRGETTKIIQKHFQISDGEVAKSFYDIYVGQGLTPDIRPTKEMWQTLYWTAVQAGFSGWPGLDTLVNRKIIGKLYK